MKISNKFIYGIAMLGLTTGVLTSCDDKIDYSPGLANGGAEVYFSNTPQTQYNLTDDATTFVITVYRSSDAEALTVDIHVTADEENTSSSAFTFPSSISFAAGQKEASYVVTYDISQIEYDDNQSFELVIDDTAATPYGVQTLVITCTYPAPWSLLGTGEYYDYYWGVKDVDDDSWTGPISVTVWQNDIDQQQFRIQNPYREWNGEDTYFEFRLLKEGKEWYGITITEPDLIGFSQYFCEYYPNYDDDLYIVWPGRFKDSETGEPVDYTKCKVLDYQDDEHTLPGEIQLGVYYYMFNTGGWNKIDPPTIKIIFPGYQVLNTDITVTYEGMEVSGTSTSGYVLADVEFSTDLSSVKVGVYPSEYSNDAIAGAINSGQIKSVELTEAGQAKIPFELSNPTDRYKIVAVGYVGDDMRSNGSVIFSHIQKVGVDDNEGWNSLGYVDYTDGYICAYYYAPAETYSVELQELASMPGYYRLVNPYGEPYPYNEEGDYDADFNSYLYIDATTPSQVVVDYSKQTLNWGDGDLTCYSYAAYYLDAGYAKEDIADEDILGSLVDNKITFPFNTLLMLMGDDGYFFANYEYDLDKLDETGEEDYLYDADGNPVAPFCVDLSSLNKTPATDIPATMTRSFAFHKPMKAKSVKPFRMAANRKRVLGKLTPASQGYRIIQ